MKTFVTAICLTIVAVTHLAGCAAPATPAGTAQPALSPAPQASATPRAQSTAPSQPTPATGSRPGQPLDLNKLDPCALVPRTEIEALFGSLSGEPKPDIPIGREKGCTYSNQQGQFVSIVLWDVDRWELLKQIFPDVKDESLLDGNPTRSLQKADALELWVLRPGVVLVEVRVSNKNMDLAKQLAQKSLARLS